MAVDEGITKRIAALIDRHTHGNVAKFAESINISRSALAKINRGEVNPSVTTLQTIIKVYPETNGAWLLTGKMSVEKENLQINSNENIQKEEVKEENLLGLIREQLNSKDKQIEALILKINQKK